MSKDILEKAFKSVGVKAKIMRSIGFHFIDVSLNIKRSAVQIRIPSNNADGIKVLATSKKFRQVLVAVQEGDERIFESNTFKSSKKPVESQENLKSLYLKNGGTAVPDARYVLRKTVGPVTYNIRAFAPPQTNKLLIGYDEKHLFVSMLKDNTVTTVAEAHRSLIPKEVRGKKYLRQGEYFFIPAPQKEIEKRIGEQCSASLGIGIYKDDDESDHTADFSFVADNGQEYVMGRIRNTRHKTIVLKTWHKVFIANEESSDNNWD